MFFIDFFKNRRFHAVRFGEVHVDWVDGTFTVFSIIFFENGNDERKWSASGGKRYQQFENTSYYAACQTWKYTGLFPEWAKDPLAEKLSRD